MLLLFLKSFTILIFFFLLSSPLFSAETYFSSYLKFRGEYDDNTAFTYYNPEEDFVTITSPSLYLNYKSERASAYSKFGLDIYKYAQLTHLDTVNQNYEVKTDYLWKERWKLFGQAYFIKDTTLESELQETGIVHVRAERKRYNVSLGTTYSLTELSQLTFDITGSKTEYEWKYYVDYDSFSISATFEHQMKTQKDALISKFYYTDIDSDTSNFRKSGYLIGWQHFLSENTKVTAFLGIAYSIVDYYLYYRRIIINPYIWPPFEIITEKKRQTERDWNYLADISFKKKGEKSTYNFNVNHDLSYSAFGEPINRTRISGSLFYKWDPRWMFFLSADYYITSSEGRVYKEDDRFFYFSSTLRYLLKEHWALNFGYSYSNFEDKFREHNFDRNRIFIILEFQFGKPSATGL